MNLNEYECKISLKNYIKLKKLLEKTDHSNDKKQIILREFKKEKENLEVLREKYPQNFI